MTRKETLVTSPGQRRVVVKGRYLTAIEQYVQTLQFGAKFKVPPSDQFDSLVAAILKLHGDWLTKRSAASLVLRESFGYAAARGRTASGAPHPLPAGLQVGLIDHLKAYLESLPRIYTLRIELPGFVDLDVQTYDISGYVCLATRNLVFDDLVAGRINALAPMLSRHKREAAPLTTYLEFRTRGYSDGSSESPPILECFSIAKQCAFLLRNFGIAKRTWSHIQAKATLTTEETGDVVGLPLPTALAEYFGDISLDEQKLRLDETVPTRLRGRHGAPGTWVDTRRIAKTKDERTQALDQTLSELSRFFSMRRDESFPSIAAAIEWYQDSVFADNQTFAYLAACIGLEAILGSEGQLDNMSKRLADRYAFLLGKGRTHREQLVADYAKVLNLRGRLVHAKAARLDDNDQDLLQLAQRMLLDATWHELHEMYERKPAR